MLAAVPPAAAAPDERIQILATINGRTVGNERVILSQSAATHLVVTLRNGSRRPLHIGSIRTSGSVLGLTFFVFDVSVRLDAPAGGSATWPVDIDTGELAGQATGLLPVTVALRDSRRQVIASTAGNADVRGSLTSVYGLFGLGLLVATGLLLGAVLLTLARQRLPANRWRRALRFVPAGCGVGCVAVVSLSVLRVTTPSATSEVTFVAGAAAVAFALGYLTPAPGGVSAGGRSGRSQPSGSRPSVSTASRPSASPGWTGPSASSQPSRPGPDRP
jgi:hypothetical protein